MVPAPALRPPRDGAGPRLAAALGTLLCTVALPATAQHGVQSGVATVQLIVTVTAPEVPALRLPGLRLGEQFQRAPRDTVLLDPRLGRVAIRVGPERGARGTPRAVQVSWQ